MGAQAYSPQGNGAPSQGGANPPSGTMPLATGSGSPMQPATGNVTGQPSGGGGGGNWWQSPGFERAISSLFFGQPSWGNQPMTQGPQTQTAVASQPQAPVDRPQPLNQPQAPVDQPAPVTQPQTGSAVVNPPMMTASLYNVNGNGGYGMPQQGPVGWWAEGGRIPNRADYAQHFFNMLKARSGQ